jgi:hypothetical protein
MENRTIFEVTNVPRHQGNPNRYAIRGSCGHVSWLMYSEKGRLISFTTKTGAQMRCDRLNADEHKRVSG